jgi:SpoVK/Ycf46/Vps4 family AAA+-type ATPase
MTATDIVKKYGWSIRWNDEDGTYDIIDEEGDVWDEATSLEDAKAVLKDAACGTYHERLVAAIKEADLEDVRIRHLEEAIRMLGVDFKRWRLRPARALAKLN